MDIDNKFCGCGQCQEKKKCANPCSCTEPVFSVEAMPDDPTTLRFNVNGKSVWYDFEPVVKAGETCTTITVDAIHRLLNYHGECSDQTITAKELGSILRLADLSDVLIDQRAGDVPDYGILNYRKDGNCGEGCEGIGDGWVATNPVSVGTAQMDYILGSTSEGELKSLMPPSDGSKYAYLAWNGSDKVMWSSIEEVAVIPTIEEYEDEGGVQVTHTYSYPIYYDPRTGALVRYKKRES